jgi:hypothetical protein
MNTAFVIGNGLSRKDINLESLRKYGKTYGCNALMRDFDPDVLVSTDPGISQEIQYSGWPKKGKHYTREPYNNTGSLELPYECAGMSSGPNALNLAIIHGFKSIYLLGIDFGSVHEKFNNVYANTEHYRSTEATPVYAGNWISHISRMIEINYKIAFSRVVNEHSLTNVFEFDNYNEITVDDFIRYHK